MVLLQIREAQAGDQTLHDSRAKQVRHNRETADRLQRAQQDAEREHAELAEHIATDREQIETLRMALAERFTLQRPSIVSEQVSVDGTRKWLLRMPPRGPVAAPAAASAPPAPVPAAAALLPSARVDCP